MKGEGEMAYRVVLKTTKGICQNALTLNIYVHACGHKCP